MYPQIIILVHFGIFQHIQQLWMSKYIHFEWTHLEFLSLHSITKCLAHTIFTSLEIWLPQWNEAFYSGPGKCSHPYTLLTLLPMGRGRKHKRDSLFFFCFSFLKETFSKVLSLISIPVLSLKYFDLLYLSRDLCSGSKSPSRSFSRCWWVILNSWRSLGPCNLLVIKKLNA